VAAPGFTVDYLNTIGGNGHGLGQYGEIYSLWSQLDKGVLTTGLQNVGGRTYNIQNLCSVGGVPVVNYYSSGSQSFPAGNVNPATICPTGGANDNYTARARTVITFPCGGNYTIDVGSDDGRFLRLTGDMTITGSGGQGGSQLVAPNTIIRFNGTGHAHNHLNFAVPAGGVVQMEAWMWEGGSGDDFEISIANGFQGGFNGTFQLLTDDVFADGCVLLDDQIPAAAINPNPGFSFDAFNLIPGGGSTDNDINSITESTDIFKYLDAECTFTGGTTDPINGAVYNIQNVVRNVVLNEIDFVGNNGRDYTVNNQYSMVIPGIAQGTQDMAYRAKASVCIPVGTWTFATRSDDGRLFQLEGVPFTAVNGQINTGGVGQDFVGFTGTSNSQFTYATFTITPAMAGGLDGCFETTLTACFFERGGGDDWEFSVAAGTHTGFTRDYFRLLQDGQFCWRVSPLDCAAATCDNLELVAETPLAGNTCEDTVFEYRLTNNATAPVDPQHTDGAVALDVVVSSSACGLLVAQETGLTTNDIPAGESLTYFCTVCPLSEELCNGVISNIIDVAARCLDCGLSVTSTASLIPPPGVVGNIYDDLNFNGVRDLGEPLVADVPVTAYDCANQVVASTITGPCGCYNLILPVGLDVRLEFGDLPAGFCPAPLGVDTVLCPVAGEICGLDIGVTKCNPDPGPVVSEIGSRLWFDCDKDGVQDPCEPDQKGAAAGLGGIEVQLFDAVGTFIASVFTGADGSYYFNSTTVAGLVAGAMYEVRIPVDQGVLQGFTTTTPDAGLNDRHDSDGVYMGTYFSAPADLTTCCVNHDVDFGFVWARAPTLACETNVEVDLGCIYNLAVIPLLIPDMDLTITNCGADAFLTNFTEATTQAGCSFTLCRVFIATNPCATNAADMVSVCTQKYTYAMDLEPPKFARAPLGGCLGCVPEGMSPQDFVCAVRPAAMDIDATVVTDSCGDENVQVSLWCDTYYTNDCRISVQRKLRAEDECGNVTLQDIMYELNCLEPEITSVETGMYLGCQPCGFVPPTNLIALSFTNYPGPPATFYSEAVTNDFTGVTNNTRVVCEIGDGTSAAMAFRSLAEMEEAQVTGLHWFDFGGAPFQGWVEFYQGRYRLLILQYHHEGGTNPVLSPGILPLYSTAPLGTNFSGTPQWGHIADAVLGTVPDAETLLFYGETDFHDRVIHFETDAFGNTALGSGNWFVGPDIRVSWVPMPGHSSFLPAAADRQGLGVGNTTLTQFPYWRNGNYHWGIRGFNRWEVDDFPAVQGGSSTGSDTIHRIWLTGPKPCDVGYEGDCAIGLEFIDNELGSNVCGLVSNGTYTATIPACANITAWDNVVMDLVLPPGTSIESDVSFAGGTLGTFTNQAFIDVSSVPPSATSIDVTVTLKTTRGDACIGPLLESIKGVFYCEEFLAPTNTMFWSVTNQFTTNGCDVTIDRTYRVETCCDLFDEEVVTFTYTKLPDLEVGPLAKLDIGCIASTNQIPPVDLTMLAASSSCAIVSIQKVDPQLICIDENFESGPSTLNNGNAAAVLSVTTDPAASGRGNVQCVDMSGPGIFGEVRPLAGNKSLLPYVKAPATGTACMTVDYFVPAGSGIGPEDRFILVYRWNDGNLADDFFPLEVSLPFSAAPGTWATLTHNVPVPATEMDGDPVCAVLPFISFADFAPAVAAGTGPDVYFDNFRVTIKADDPVFEAEGGCTNSVLRTFEIETLCGVNKLVSQEVCYILNNTRPEILATAKNAEDFGCVDTEPRTLADSLAALVITNATVTTLVSEVRMNMGCEVMVTRTWRVEDCCGNFDRREETYMYTPGSGMLATATVNPTVDVGCVTSLDLIPASPQFTLRSTGNIYCYKENNRYFTNRILTRSDQDPASFTSPDGGFSFQMIRMNDDGGFLLRDQPVGPEMNTALFSQPVCFSAEVGNLNCDAICISPPPDAIQLGTDHIVSNGVGEVCIYGTNCADTATATVVFFTNATVVKVTGIDGTSDFRINTDFAYTTEVTEFVDGDGNLVYLDGNGDDVTLPADAELCRQGCDIDVSFVTTQASMQVFGGCTSGFERVYQVAANCSTSTVTQTVLYVLDTEPPRIVAVSNYVDYGCVPSDPRSLEMSTNGLVTTDDNTCLSTQMVMQVAVNNGCDWTVTRSWRVEDSCGNFDLKDEVYSFTITPTALVFTVAAPPTLDLGCITSTNQVPPAVPSLLKAEAPIAFCPVTSMFFFEAEDATVRSGVNNASVHAGFTGTGYADFGGSGTFVEFTVPGGATGGPANITFRYAVGSNGPRSADVVVNGTTQGVAVFALTPGGWTDWTDETVAVTLSPGPNTIRIVAQGNGPNLDSLAIDLSCIDPVDLACDTAIHWVGDTVKSNILCQTFIERVYLATNDCGLSAMSTQCITYILNEAPSILGVPPSENFGCITAAPCLPDPWAGVVLENAIISNVTAVITENPDCSITMVRTYEAVNCCGVSASTTATYTWTSATPAPTIVGPALVDLGCILDVGNIPVPSVSQFQTVLTNDLYCATDFEDGKIPADWTIVDGNPGDANDPDFQVVMDAAGNNILLQANADLATGGGTSIGGYALLPKTFCSFTACFDFCLNDQSMAFEDAVFVFGDNGAGGNYHVVFSDSTGAMDIYENNGIGGGRTIRVDNYSGGFDLDDDLCYSTCISFDDTVRDVIISIEEVGNPANAFSGTFPLNDTTYGPGQIGFGSYNDAPSFDNIEITGSSDCSGAPQPVPCGADVAFVSSSATNALDAIGCMFEFTNTYEAAGGCSPTGRFEQTIRYTLSLPPEIVSVEKGSNLGCRVAGYVPPTNLAAIVATNAISTNVSDVIMQVACETMIMRTYRVENCCNRFDERVETYTYTPIPDLPSVEPLMDLDLGCIASTNQIPPVDLTMAAVSAECGVVSIRKISTSAPIMVDDCTMAINRCFEVTTLCGISYPPPATSLIQLSEDFDTDPGWATTDNSAGANDPVFVVANGVLSQTTANPDLGAGSNGHFIPSGFALPPDQFCNLSGCFEFRFDGTGGDQDVTIAFNYQDPMNFYYLLFSNSGGRVDLYSVIGGTINNVMAPGLDGLVHSLGTFHEVCIDYNALSGALSVTSPSAGISYSNPSFNPGGWSSGQIGFGSLNDDFSIDNVNITGSTDCAFTLDQLMDPTAIGYCQRITYTLETVPQIISVPKGTNFGCQAATFRIPPCFTNTVGGAIEGLSLTAGCIDDITVGRGVLGPVTYNAAQLIGVDLTCFTAGGGSELMVPGTDPVPPTGTRADLIEDLCIDTGILNPTTGPNGMCFTFNSPVCNSHGPDLVFFELDPSGNDPVVVTINGVSVTYSTYQNISGNFPTTLYDIPNLPNLAALETGTPNGSTFLSDQNLWGLTIDLDDFGVTGGSCVMTMSLSAGNANERVDPVFLAGLPNEYQDAPVFTNALGIDCSDWYVTNGCEVAVTRVFIATNCCGNFDRREVDYSYTLQPGPATVDALAHLDLGCINGTNNIPAPSAAIISAMSTCSVTAISWCGDTPAGDTFPAQLEGEDMTLGGAWAVFDEPVASGGQYIEVPNSNPGSGDFNGALNSADCASGTIKVFTPGLYRIVARVRTPAGTDDSFYVRVDGDPSSGFRWFAGTSAAFSTRVVTDSGGGNPQAEVLLGCGDHLIEVCMREDGSQLDWIGLELVEAQPVGPCDCPEAIVRCYDVTDVCGEVITVNQCITYIEDSAPPRLTVPGYAFFDCVTADPCPAPDFSQVSATDDNGVVSTQMIMEVRQVQECNVLVTRTWRVEDCCGNFDIKDQVYGYSIMPTNFANVAAIADLELGCISDAAQVPAPSPLFFSADALGAIGVVPTQTVLSADADAYVRGRSESQNSNFGTGVALQIKYNLEGNGRGDRFNRKAYIRYDVSPVASLGKLTNAVLCLPLVTGGGTLEPGQTYTFAVYGLNDGDPGEGWAEGGITWNNAPQNAPHAGQMAAGMTLLGRFTVFETGVGSTINFSDPRVLQFVQGDSDGQVTFAVVRETQAIIGGAYTHAIQSKEGGDGAQLKLGSAVSADLPINCPVGITWAGDAVVETTPCTTTVERVYIATNDCGLAVMTIQTIRYTIDRVPEILMVEKGIDYGCVPANFYPGTNFGAGVWLATNAVSTNVMDMVMTSGCEVMLRRSYVIRNCCGEFDRREEVYTWTVRPDVTTLDALASLDLGCIASTNQIPTPTSLISEMDSACGGGQVVWLGDQLITGDVCPPEIEAEAMALSGNFVLGFDPVASGGSYIEGAGVGSGSFSAPNANTAEAGFTVLTPGTYQLRVWLRTPNNGPNPDANGNNDSFFYAVDGILGPGPWNRTTSTVAFPSRVVAGTWDLTCGEHTVTLFQREDGTEIDRVALELVAATPEPLCECPDAIVRTYQMTDLCGGQTTVQQCFTYTLDTAPPRIDAVSNYVDYACVTTEPRPLADSLAAVIGSDIDGNLLSTNLVQEVRLTNGCFVTVTRSWRVEDCCGNFDLRDETYSYTDTPAITAMPMIQDLNLGCIATTNSIPPPSALLLGGNFACGANITFQDRFLGTDGFCTWTNQRVFSAMDECGGMLSFTQLFTYTLDTGNPLITAVPAFTNYGCVAGDPRPLPRIDQVAAVDDGNIVLTQLVMEMRSVIGHEIEVTRTWRVEDCCGNWHEKDSVYRFTPSPTNITVATLPDLNLGCLDDMAQIPQPDPDIVDATVFPRPITNCSFVLIKAGKDSYVWNDQAPGPNLNGSQPWIQVGDITSMLGDSGLKGYLQFDLSGAPFNPLTALSGACLEFSVNSVNPNASGYPACFEVLTLPEGDPGEAWTEALLEWANAPFNDTASNNQFLPGLSYVADFVITNTTSNTTVQLCGTNLANVLTANLDGIVTLLIRGKDPVSAPILIGSRENMGMPGVTPPTLRIDSCVETPIVDLPYDVVWTNDMIVSTSPNGCTTTVERVYVATEECGLSASVTQTITYLENGSSPEITWVEIGIDWGCQPSGWTPPTNLTASLMATNAISTNISDKISVTNCTASVQRTFRVENCCGDFDTRVVTHTYTITPDGPGVDALADLDLGCIPNASLVPQPSTILFAASSSCAVVSILWTGDTALSNAGCVSSLERGYLATDLCGQTNAIVQTIQWIENDTDPAITVPAGIDFGCSGLALPAEWDGVTATNFITSNVVTSTDASDPCLTTVTRTYSVADCCGDSASASVVYTFIPSAPAPTLAGPELIDLGCIADLGQIPVPSTSQFSGTSTCGAVIAYVGSSTTNTTVCSHEFIRTYRITDQCGGTNDLLQTIRYSIDTDDPKFLVLPGGDLGCAPVTLPSPADDILAMTVTDACSQTTMFVNESSNLVDCTWTLVRNYMAIDDCDNSAVAQVTYTWTLRPPAPTLDPLAELDAGCVSSPAAVPGPSLALLSANTTCSETLSWRQDLPADLLPGQACIWSFERVYQVEDGCGEIATTTQTVTYTLESTVQITAVPPPQDFGCVTVAPPIPSAITTTGNVQNTTIADTLTTNDCRVTLVREWTSTGCCGEFDQASQTFNWTETPGAPSLIGPLQIDLGCIADEGQIPQPSTSQFTPVAGCGARVHFVAETPVNVIDNCNRALNRTYEITDSCGQTNQVVQSITWTLNDIPVEITATESGGHLGCLALAPLTAPTTLPPELTSVVVVGNPTGLFVNVTLTNDGCLATLTREYTTRDCCGNFDRATVVWTWDIEQAPPVITGPALIALGCISAAGQVPVPSTSQFTVQSACGSSIALLSESTPSTAACVTSLERVYQASGNCGESATFTQTVTWVLGNPPNLTAPAGQTFGCESADPAPSLDWTTVTLGGGLVVSSNAFENTTIDGCTATKVLTYNVIGCCGGQVSDSVTYTWTVQPAPPTLAGPERIDLGCLADVGQIPVPNPAAFTVASDCSASTAFVVETPLPADGCTNLLERVYTATDNCGQTTTLSQTITWVTDGGAPVITSAPPGGDLGCAPVTVPVPDPNAIVAQDGCRVASIIHLADITNRVGCVINLRRVYRVTDLCNNRTDLDVRYHWTDDAEAPTLTPPAGFQAVNFLGCNPNIGIGNIPPVDLSGWSATDNCGSVIPRFFGDEITTNGCAVRVERVFHAIDTCGNTTTATQTYRYVLDNAQPTPTLTPSDLDLGCDITGPGDIPAPDATIWTADDMCGPIIATNHIGDTTTSIGCETFVTRTFEFTDDCGNTGQASQVLRYRADNAAPTILCPPDEELGCNPQSVPAPNAALAFVSDDCGQPTVIHLGDTATTNGCAVEILRVFQAIDSCGKTSTCTQRISFVQDSDAPTHNAPADAELGCNPTDIPAANFVATDACSLSTNVTETTATSGCLVTLTRTWNVADACGNTTEHIQTLTWTENNEAPTLLAPPALELGCNPASIPAPNPAQVQATDDCGLGPVTHVSDTETDDGCARMILRVFEATDNCGNSAVVTQAITWSVSTESPTLTDAPLGQTLACNAAVPAPNPSAIAAQAGCGNATAVLAAVITNQTACMLTVVHEYLIADACGNQVTHQVNWGIPQDSEAPTINCPANVSLTADALCEARVDDLLTGAFSDNCGIVESTQEPPVGTVLGLGNHTITLTALDTCGNATTCTVPVTVMGGCTPGIDIQKTVASGHGADCSTAIESLSHTNGAPITWCLRVENTGTVPLEDVTVRDLPINYQNTIPGVMQPGDVVLLSVDATLTIDLVNTASVTGEPLNGAPQVSDADPAEVHPVSASIALLKTVAIGENAQCPAVELIDRQQGDMVTYCFEVTNTGEIPLTDVSVVDPMLSATPIPVVGTLLPGQTAVIGVPDMFDGAPITNVAYATGAADSLPDTASGGAPILATPLDPAIVMPPCGCAGGTVFNDLANDGSSDGDNLANLGIPGVTVELYAGGSAAGTPIATMASDVDGRYTFAPLMSGTYTVRYDPSTLPADFAGFPEKTVTLGPCDCIENIDLPAVPSPTAVRLDGFKVHPTDTGLLFSWTTGSEIDTLGFRVLDAAGASVSPRLVLAGAGQYALHVPGLRAGTYSLEEVANDLDKESLATVQVIDAAPQGPPTETVEAVEGLAQFETVKGVTSYLVIGFATPPTATTANGDVLAGALLEVDGDHAIYLSPRPGLQLTVE